MSNKIEPIKPHEVAERKVDVIDPVMIDVVNNLLKLNYSGGVCRIFKNEVVENYMERPDRKYATTEEIYAMKQLDFEPIYKLVGWDVHYDKPGFNENYESAFVFSKK